MRGHTYSGYGEAEYEEASEFAAVAEWLERHARECLARADAWLVSSLPVPTELLARMWPDEAWRSALRDLVVAAVDEGPERSDRPGFPRDVTASGELLMVRPGDETVRLSPTTVTLPHPLLLPDLAELREFASFPRILFSPVRRRNGHHILARHGTQPVEGA
ncbi:DUF4132 domain-containing protein [Streptomyces graminilatus]|uniref:DUF4132 domain-containing protein n=1 Tax=Streptomyces graminilatus TaxID=1464070 RepID=UPI00099F3BAB